MLNTFHVCHVAGEADCTRRVACRLCARAGGHDGQGGETRVRKLCYRSVNASEKVQLPPASDVRQRGGFKCGPLALSLPRGFLDRRELLLLGVAMFAVYPFIHRRLSDVYSPPENRAHDTPQKKRTNTPRDQLRNFHHLVTSTERIGNAETRQVRFYHLEVDYRMNRTSFQPDAAAHNEFRCTFKGSTFSARGFSSRQENSICAFQKTTIDRHAL
ncbi:hypothetical protein X777_04781 [Ooceraea biroi]|uniref:Uncharacterized protein n=1 Tax=Ooceraea biroi TaxID=2015173 RepID=A0A026WH90_OOCBI|nr:hypothetical protein X777_04781 [Ooceraea biroi]